MTAKQQTSQDGFTLVEVLVSIGILVTMVVAVAQMMSSSFDVRESLSLEYRSSHSFRVAMRRVTNDLQHAYIIPSDDLRHVEGARKKTVFRLQKGTHADELRLTYRDHKSIRKNEKVSDISFVVYRVEEKEGRKHLYRGTSGRLPESFEELPSMELIARDIKTFRVETFNGESWSKDRWDSQGRDTRDKLPPMARVILEALDYEEGIPTERLRARRFATVIRLAYSLDSETLKDPITTLRL
ncbi:MAG: type II secretion system protein J [Oligoflexales bacterium]